MGSKKLLTPFTQFAAHAVTGTNTYSSPITDVRNLDNIGIQLSWTGTPTGNFSVLGSNDGTNFFALTFSPTITQPAGASGISGVNITQFPFFFIQLQYVNVSGSGTISALMTCKDVN